MKQCLICLRTDQADDLHSCNWCGEASFQVSESEPLIVEAKPEPKKKPKKQ